MLKIFLLLIIVLTLDAKLIPHEIKPAWLKSSKYMGINILDSKELLFGEKDGVKVTELSALAYKDKKLFALSDRGYLYLFNLLIEDEKIKKLKLTKAMKLKNKKNTELKKSKSDSEGMVLVDDMLYISFEREPRVEIFSLNAQKIKQYKIAKELRDTDNYQGENKALESVAYSRKFGVVTAAELPLKNRDQNLHVIYAKDRTWKFKATASLTAIEFIDDHKLLTLERNFNKSFHQTVITLTKVFLDECDAGVCRSDVMAHLDSKEGWSLDNFEGLTKIGKNKFLMISDDNGNTFQKTLLVLFEIAEN